MTGKECKKMNKQTSPPKWIKKILSVVCDPDRLEAILGDLEELYQEKQLDRGRLKANIFYLIGAIGFLRPFAWKKIRINNHNSTIMLKNYLKIIWRTIYRRPLPAISNLSCLTLGIAAALLILLYLDFELNFDRVHIKAEDIYRIDTRRINARQRVIDVDWQNTPANLAPLIEKDFPEVVASVRFYSFYDNEGVRFHYHDKVLEEDEIITVDSSLLDVFSFDLIEGNPKTALRGPNKIIISENLAKRLFPGEAPLGKILKSQLVHRTTNEENEYAFKVTGVYKDLPRNTHLFAHAFVSAETDKLINDYYFSEFFVSTYLLLNPQTDPQVFAPKLSQIYERYHSADRDPTLVSAEHGLVALPEIHFADTNGLAYVYIFSGVGFLLLIIAFISYVNMVTALGSKRAMEIGVRKVMGSHRQQLIVQFLTESLFFTLLSLFLALVLVFVMIEPINSLLDLNLLASQLWQPLILAGMIGIIVVLGIIGGSYPAFFLSSFRPIAVMKGKLVKPAPLRRFLVAFQFAVVIFVLASTGMIYQQLEFLRSKDLGFSQENSVQLELSGVEGIRKWPVLKQSLLASPEITSVSSSNFLPGIGGMIRGPISVEGSEPEFTRRGRIDYDFLELMDIEILQGRNFSTNHPSDSFRSTIVNETLVRDFNLGDNPIGKKLKFGDWGNPNHFEIIGVVEDFHQHSLHHPIEPQLLTLANASNAVTVKLGSDLRSGIEVIEKAWTETFPDKPFEYHFLDTLLLDRYEEDQRRGSIFFYFSLITIFIAFVGLFGLASYLVGQRTKEVGIRKVFGAKLKDIVILLSKDFLFLVILAALPGLVVAWFVINRWLENFAFQTGMNYLLFGLVFLLVLLLTFATVSWHAVRTAHLNPKDALKYE